MRTLTITLALMLCGTAPLAAQSTPQDAGYLDGVRAANERGMALTWVGAAGGAALGPALVDPDSPSADTQAALMAGLSVALMTGLAAIIVPEPDTDEIQGFGARSEAYQEAWRRGWYDRMQTRNIVHSLAASVIGAALGYVIYSAR